MTKPQEQFMRRAIHLSEKSGTVFGAFVVKDNEVIGEGYNQVVKHNDPTWHAEMQAIREACKRLGTPHLEGCILYTSAECCPMCLCASYWAHIDKIYYGATIEDTKNYDDFEDVDFLAEIKKDPKDRKIKFIEFLRDDAVDVWKRFSAMPDLVHY